MLDRCYVICDLFVSFLNESYIFYHSIIITLISNVRGCSKKPLHMNYFDLKRVKNVAICKLEDSSAETKGTPGE